MKTNCRNCRTDNASRIETLFESSIDPVQRACTPLTLSAFIGVHRRLQLVIALALLSLVLPAHAQPYPSRPVRLIVPLAAGGAMDTIARGVGAKLTDNLGQTVVVDNRGGGGGTIGAELVAAAAPDGYTLIMMSATSVIRPLLYSARYEMFRDFAPISQVSAQPYLLVTHPSIPAKT